ncbi:MAG: hypothetical protein ABSH35_16900 [Isosphaeraceae bacterium]|jgi:hypothetical protein
MTRYVFSSVTRISDLPQGDFSVESLPRGAWEMGDYVVGQVKGGGGEDLTIELPNGRMIEADESDLVVGAFGKRHATLDATGDWEAIGPDGLFHALTEGGLFGKCLSRSPYVKPLMSLDYRGHVLRNSTKVRMQDCAARAAGPAFTTPIVLLIGSSMSAGKTTTAKIIIRLLKSSGRRVLAAKLNGAGRYHDVLTMADAGADAIFDFVDAGLPSTVCSAEDYRRALRPLLSRMATVAADVAVIEIGSSPLEPYNGAVTIKEIGRNVRVTILCASDPYAVLGVMSAFEVQPDLVTGIVANTGAGRELVEKLSGVRALNLKDPSALPELMAMLRKKLWGEDHAGFSPWVIWTGL